MWRNWAGDQVCEPAVAEQPADVDQVIEAIGRAATAGREVRVAGSGHSFSDIVLTRGTLLSVDRMTRVLDVDRATGLVRVQPGITIHDLSAELDRHGLGLANLGDYDGQTIAGATATGTHGTGIGLGNLSTQIEGMELVLADGSVRQLTGGEALRAARVGIGALGVVSELTLRCLPAFTLHAIDEPLPLEEVLASADELADANDHFEFFTFPHTSIALTKRNNRTDREPAPPGPVRRWVNDILLENVVLEALCRAGRRAPSRIPAINRVIAGTFSRRERVERSFRIFATERRVRFTEMEVAVPRERGVEAVRAVLDVIESNGFLVPFPLEVRWAAGDDAFLSPASGRDTTYIAVHMFNGMEWQPYFRAVEEVLGALGGRPHWGKRHSRDAAFLRDRYPDWDAFQAVRAELDPEGRFANAYVRRVLGLLGAVRDVGDCAGAR